ncbi:hypothetical protein HUJ04_000446 [Dendroctonus ponderosae]|nr:hypothetical protein HUJ04_000446 [Dendroctonus ponderosae]
MAHSINGDTVSECSEASTLIDGSVISTVPDRHGFLGIPMSIRPRAWLYICGGHQLMTHNPGRYEECLRAPGEAKSLEDIKKDIHRQFPTHEMFNSEDKPGQHELLNVLKAYTVNNPEIGYCQAQAPVAAFLLMHMPAEQAFWCLLKKVSPQVYRHLKKVNAEPMFYCTEWFLCAFTRTLPWDTLLRVWDVFLCEGIKILFKTALVILIGCLGTAKSRRNCPGLCETLARLRNPPEEILNEENLIYNINRLDITERDFQIEHQKQTKKIKLEKLAKTNSDQTR